MKQKDQLLLELLRQNARASVSALARTLGVSRSTLQDRLSRLEEMGVIAGYTVRLGDRVDAHHVRAIVMLKVAPRAQDTVVRACREMPSVAALYTVAGEFDLAAHVIASDTEALDSTLDQLGKQPGVERTLSSVLLSKKFERS